MLLLKAQAMSLKVLHQPLLTVLTQLLTAQMMSLSMQNNSTKSYKG